MEGSPRKRRAPKLLRGLQSKIGGKKSPAKPAAPPVSQQDHREAVLSLQQMALKIHSLQEQTTEKRKTLHALLLKADSTSDPAELDKIKMRAADIREELYNNELLMGNFEHTIERANGGNNDAFAVCAAFERYIEQTCQDNMDKITITAPTPTVISSLDELPDDIVDKISKAGILKDHCTTNFDQVLAVLRFIEKKQVYCTEAQLARWKSVKIGELMLPNYGRISKPIEHFLTDDKLALQPKKIYKFYGAEGQGGFGKVYHAKNKKTGNDVAIKKLKANTESQRRQIANEVSFLAFCSHQNLVPFENVFQIKNDEIWIVMEYIGGGTVNNALKKKSFSESIIATVSDQLLLALKYLHSNGIVHRDLKADNVMLTEFGEVFLVDMGLCVDLEEFNPACNSIGGTLPFMSPEAINGEEITPAVDIWSLGVTALEMANGCNPFSDNPILKMFQVAAKQVPSVDSLLLDPSKWSDSFKDFISVCLNPDSSTRATAEQLLTHPWFTETISGDSQEELIHLVRYCWSSEVAPMF